MNARNRIRTSLAIALLGLMAVCVPPAALAHPMGNFAICHYTRIMADKGGLRLRYILDIAEIPTLEEKQRADRNGDGGVDDREQAAYYIGKARELTAGLSLTVDRRPVPLQVKARSMGFTPGAAGLDTLKITLDLQAPYAWSTRAVSVSYRDGNYPARTGWKEVVATSGEGAILQDSSVPSAGRSRELSAYPADASIPQDMEARFMVVSGGKETGSPSTPVAGTQRPNDPTPLRPATPRDAFTEAISRKNLTPGFILAGLLIAFVFGAFHALGPGHGKAMVAAYLVGARGTAKHAAILGAVVTITHTLGVFLLGFATLFASRYVVPAKLYPILSAISGLSVVTVGVWLFWRRLRGMSEGHHHHHHDHDHAHDHHPGHGHSHEHSHDHAHDLDHSHSHSHTHHHIPEGPITARALIVLGISGGMVPCPSALVVLLAAVSLHRIAYGMALITAFSLGLASVLILIGLLVVWGRNWMDRLPSGGALLQRLPVASAAMITVIGVVLLVRAFAPMTP